MAIPLALSAETPHLLLNVGDYCRRNHKPFNTNRKTIDPTKVNRIKIPSVPIYPPDCWSSGNASVISHWQSFNFRGSGRFIRFVLLIFAFSR